MLAQANPHQVSSSKSNVLAPISSAYVLFATTKLGEISLLLKVSAPSKFSYLHDVRRLACTSTCISGDKTIRAQTKRQIIDEWADIHLAYVSSIFCSDFYRVGRADTKFSSISWYFVVHPHLQG